MEDGTKEILGIINILCDQMDLRGLTSMSGFSTSAKQLLRMDLLRFTWYIAAADERITNQESELIGEVLGIGPINPDELIAMIKNAKADILPSNYESEVPPILKVFVAFDRLYAKEMQQIQQRQQKAGVYAYGSLIGLFDMVGRDLITCDGNIDAQEKLRFYSYIDNMNLYAKKELSEGTVFVGGKK